MGYVLFFLSFFTFPLGMSEDSPILMTIPFLVWTGAILFGGER
jgi:hypothetical protein